ncbi:bifunctional hydroxymethylpyrimidine kinase/phosphomethylpyrimidine kinase [Bacillus sp. FJAT-29790]|uniref:bifunctional hydroxymethylpyrimidine kinase/phosphomethylpyrimidine kinase n=1 Tax=Bacillus sp. FJAT-29790 TaxID=1895002 RepID=UPI001C2344A9|nr:bifunctional hydroxymethylpyrimidine kinase/phosphomethylpyrimidine kinase [Bacillus sp. FJAT-29790]MBU8878453.1 bifunctional hydroxymethylpyrimidine kinase/phosphomethylpyrimidine kinase [Bacillus sp. FJAT-29790]
MKTALTIAGSDSGGGAGIQADLKAFAAHGVYGMSVITAVTAQNTLEVRSVQNMEQPIIKDQMEAVFDDIRVDAVKIGMLSSAATVDVVAQSLEKYKPALIVLDPVMVSKGGHYLLQEEAISALKDKMIPLSTIITPNIPEAEVLIKRPIHTDEDMKDACLVINSLGAKTVLLKGGHLSGEPNDLFYDGANFHWLNGKRIHTNNTHGTGCTLSSAITANLAKGASLIEAIQIAKKYIEIAIAHSLDLGNGHGPTNHFYELYKKANLIPLLSK